MNTEWDEPGIAVKGPSVRSQPHYAHVSPCAPPACALGGQVTSRSPSKDTVFLQGEEVKASVGKMVLRPQWLNRADSRLQWLA